MKIYTQSELQSIQKDVFFFMTEGEELKEGIKGIAKIRYPEGSVYTGQSNSPDLHLKRSDTGNRILHVPLSLVIV